MGFGLTPQQETPAPSEVEDKEAEQLRQYRALKRRTVWAIALALPVAVIGMAFMDLPYANYVMWLLPCGCSPRP